MFRAQCCAVLGFGLMLAAASTEARELEFSVENRIVGDNNVFRASSNRVADGLYEISPRVAVREGNSRLNYDFSYRPTYQAYFTTSGINGFDHLAQGVLSWRPTAIDTLGFSGNFASRRTLRIEDQSGALNPIPSLQETDRERLNRSDARISYDHKIGESFSVQGSGTFSDSNYRRNTSIDSRAYSGRLGTQYVLDSNTSVGISGSFRQRENDSVIFQFTSKTDIWDVSASIQRSLTPTLRISVQAGPSFIRTNQKSSSVFIPARKSRSTSYFAAATIDKTWQRSTFRASYSRFESDGGGTASSSITDNVTLDFKHSVSRRWSVRVFGSWLQSKEISSVPGAIKQDTSQYRAFASITRKISRQLSVVGQFSYFIQDQNDVATAGSIGSIYSGFLSLRYTFDPVIF